MTVTKRLEVVRERIAEASVRSGRSPEAVSLVGISKGATPELIAETIGAGLLQIGENRVQEAASKIPRVVELAGVAPQWHLVGHLQSNKARAALQLFDTIQAVDSERIAETISHLATRTVQVFLEVQFARISGRFGFEPCAVQEAYRTVSALPNIEIVGLMTVPPTGLTVDGVRAVFHQLREHAVRIDERDREDRPLEVSMGMSEDYQIAIEQGATLVRIGRAIFAG